MNTFSVIDYECMARALQLARRGLYSTHPNPRVGCVLLKDDKLIGDGWHRAAGLPHAEIDALATAGSLAAGATAYVTLEPCAHQGRTGPCSQALLAAGVRRVVAAVKDPSPAVAGSGFDELRRAGIQVDIGLMQQAARDLNAGFFSRMERGRPFVRVKIGVSIDGATAMAGGESQWITGSAARRDVQRLRARSDAILTGIGTVLADDPSLTIRDIDTGRPPPLRLVVDSTLRTPTNARILDGNAPTLICCRDDSMRRSLERPGVEIVKVAAAGESVALDKLLAWLAGREINEVLVEAGPRLAGAFLQQDLVDELVIYQAPHIMGSETRPLAATPALTALQDRLSLDVIDRRQVGADTRITARRFK